MNQLIFSCFLQIVLFKLPNRNSSLSSSAHQVRPSLITFLKALYIGTFARVHSVQESINLPYLWTSDKLHSEQGWIELIVLFSVSKINGQGENGPFGGAYFNCAGSQNVADVVLHVYCYFWKPDTPSVCS